MNSSIENVSIINLLDILGIKHDELISRNTIKEIISSKMLQTNDTKKQAILQKIYDKLMKYLDKLNLNTIFRIDDLSLNKNLVNRENDKFTIKNQAMKMDHAFIQTVAQGELNPLKKRTKSYILHINTKYREKNSSNLYDKQIIKSVKNTIHTNKIQQLLNNMINIKSIIIKQDDDDDNVYIFTLILDVSIPADYLEGINNTVIYGYTKLDFILNENINANNIFNTHNLTNITDIIKNNNRSISFTVDLTGQPKSIITTAYQHHSVNVDNIPYTYVPDYGNNARGKPITTSEYEAWDKSDTLHEFALANRERVGLPPVNNYGTRRVFAPRTNNSTYINYGNYEKNTVAVMINSGNPPLLSKQDTEHKENGIYKEPNNDFTINLSSIFNNVIKMSMESFSFTNSIYTFSSMRKNNYFEINKEPIVIPDGTYTGDQLGSFLDKIIQNNSLSTLHAGFSKITGKIFFYDNEGRQFMLVFGSNTTEDITNKNKVNESVEKNAGWIMGFKRSYYESYKLGTIERPDDASKIIILNDNTTPTPSITKGNYYVEAESIYNEHSCKNLFLVVDDFNYNHYNNHYNSFNSDIVNSHILAKIHLKDNLANNFSFVHDTMGDLEYRVRDYFGPVTIERLNIKLIDEEGNAVDINETDYNLTLRLDSLHDL